MCECPTTKNNCFLTLVVLLAIVGGVAWFRSTRGRPDAAPPGPANPAPAAAAPGELCPEQPPLVTASAPATSPAAPATQRLPRLVDLGADKCKACKELAPILEELRKEYHGRVAVEFIDVWKNPRAGEPYNIRVIPTQILFDAEGREVWRHEGFLPKADFVAKFAELGVR